MSPEEPPRRRSDDKPPPSTAAGLQVVAGAAPGDRRHANILDYAPHAVPPVLPTPQGGIVDARTVVRHAVARVGPALGNVFLIPHPWVGMILWVALASTQRLALYGLLGLGIAVAVMAVLGIGEEIWAGGGLKANTLMATVLAGWLMAPTTYPLPTQIAIAATAAVATFAVTATVMRALRKAEFPSLLWGYCLIAVTLFAIFPIATQRAVAPLTWWQAQPHGLVDWAATFLRSTGALLFAPTAMAGAIIAAAAVLWSRTGFVAGVIGWIAGTLVALEVQALGVPYVWLPASYNFFIAGMAIGAFLIVPGYASLLLAAAAGAASSLIGIALQSLLPVFAYLPVSSALTVWIGLGTLALSSDRRGFWRNRWPQAAPEEAWWRDTLWLQRVGRGEPLLVVPLSGAVQIGEGLGSPSPSSSARRARQGLDLLRAPTRAAVIAEVGATGTATAPDHPPANSLWNAPVTAPGAGVVERVRDGVVDNPVGSSSFTASWGNYVCLRLDQGGWAFLAHLKQGSIAVAPGTRVELGTVLGAVGNSGRSAVPHLHLRVQAGPERDARPIPFRLANYRSGPTADEPLRLWNGARIPDPGSVVMHAEATARVHWLLTSLVPGRAVWMVDAKGTLPRAFREPRAGVSIEVGHAYDEEGQYRLTSGASTLVAMPAPDAWRIIEQNGPSPLLRLIAHAVPTIPYAAEVGLTWNDIVPAMPAGLARWITLSLGPYRLHPFTYAGSVCRLAYGRRATDRLVIETVLAPHRPSLPSKIVCSFDKLRGPVELEATFDGGSVRYSLLSFAPGSPS